MQGSRNVRIILDLTADGETIRGLVSKADQASRPFFGWLELAGVLEAARQEASEPAADVGVPGLASHPLGSR